MPANNKHKSPLAAKKDNAKPQKPSNAKPSSKMDASETETTAWATNPIMDTDPKPKSGGQGATASTHKQYMTSTASKSGGMKQQRQLSSKAKKRKEVAAIKAEAFKDQLATKIEKSTGRR